MFSGPTDADRARSDMQTAEFQLALGRALIEWNRVEGAFAFAFEAVTGMENRMAQAVFNSANAFGAKCEMLLGALRVLEHGRYREFLIKAEKKARMLGSFRNRLAHSQMMYPIDHNTSLAGAPILFDTRKPGSADGALELTNAAGWFSDLQSLVVEATHRRQDASALDRCFQKLSELPNDAQVARNHLP